VLARTIGEGFDRGRPSLLKASAEKKAGQVVATHIGGRCVPMMLRADDEGHDRPRLRPRLTWGVYS
jgi:hypothetical protein